MRNLSARINDRINRLPFLFRVIKARPGQGWLDSATSYEIEYPYRQGASVIVRVWRRALMLGILDNHPDLDDDAIDRRLLAAIKSADGGRSYWDTPEAREEWARKTVAKHATGPEDEVELLDKLGMWPPQPLIEGKRMRWEER